MAKLIRAYKIVPDAFGDPVIEPCDPGVDGAMSFNAARLTVIETLVDRIREFSHMLSDTVNLTADEIDAQWSLKRKG